MCVPTRTYSPGRRKRPAIESSIPASSIPCMTSINSLVSSPSAALSRSYSMTRARFFASKTSRTATFRASICSSSTCSVSGSVSVEFSIAFELYTLSGASTSSIIDSSESLPCFRVSYSRFSAPMRSRIGCGVAMPVLYSIHAVRSR